MTFVRCVCMRPGSLGPAPITYQLCLVLLILWYISILAPCMMLVCLLPLVFLNVGSILRVAEVLQGATAYRRRAPASPAQLSRLPLATFERGPGEAESKSCIICLEPYEEGEQIRVLPCDASERHHFHRACVDRWLLQSGSCPVCRTTVAQMLRASAPASPRVASGRSDMEDVTEDIETGARTE